MKPPLILISPRLIKKGPTFRVVIKPSAPTSARLTMDKKIVPSVRVLAMIDTGASTTAVSQNVIRRLKLNPRGAVKVYTSNKAAEIRYEFDISLYFGDTTFLPLLRVLGANLAHQRIDCLIGRDVLQFGKLIYDGPRQRVNLSF